jgi:diguanylate cyclase (GGDEF)-like protein
MEPRDGDLLEKVDHLGREELLALLDGLRTENEALRSHLQHVVSTAASNEKIWRHFIEIERILFRTIHLDQLVEELLIEIKDRFQLDAIILFISHPEIIERFFPTISPDSEPVAEGAWILPLPAEAAESLIREEEKPALLTPETLERLGDLLPEDVEGLRSGVLIPLCFHQMLFGRLLLGSSNAERYRCGDGTDLLEQLGAKIALCLDNCLVYEGVKDLAVQDQWTGLLSYFQIHAILEREFRKARRLERPLSLVLMELDFYQEAKDQPDIGTAVLQHVAELLRGIFTEDDAFLGRCASDEFVMVLPDTALEEAGKVAAHLHQLIRRSPCRYENAAILIQPTMAAVELNDAMKRPQDALDAAYLKLCRLRTARSQSVA